MSRITAIVASIIVAVISIGLWVLGGNLVMPLADAREKGVGAGPWFLVWGMIALSVLCSAILVVFLIGTLRSPSRR